MWLNAGGIWDLYKYEITFCLISFNYEQSNEEGLTLIISKAMLQAGLYQGMVPTNIRKETVTNSTLPYNFSSRPVIHYTNYQFDCNGSWVAKRNCRVGLDS